MKYFVTEKRPKSPGHEYQMIDDTGYPGKLTPLQLTGTSTLSCQPPRTGRFIGPVNGTRAHRRPRHPGRALVEWRDFESY